MRENKFRGKRVDNSEWMGEWVEGSLVNNLWSHRGSGKSVCEIIVNEAGFDSWEDLIDHECIIEVEPDTVGQFTGEKDKDKKELFEGDVVMALFEKTGNINGNHTNPYKTKCEIVFEGGSFMLFNRQKHAGRNSRNWERRPMRHHELKEMEKIGNIHDQPQLVNF